MPSLSNAARLPRSRTPIDVSFPPQTTSKLLSSGVVRDAATTQRLDALATELLSSRVYGGAGAPAHTRKAALAVLSAAR
jgi:hypothetical protein